MLYSPLSLNRLEFLYVAILILWWAEVLYIFYNRLGRKLILKYSLIRRFIIWRLWTYNLTSVRFMGWRLVAFDPQFKGMRSVKPVVWIVNLFYNLRCFLREKLSALQSRCSSFLRWCCVHVSQRWWLLLLLLSGFDLVPKLNSLMEFLLALFLEIWI